MRLIHRFLAWRQWRRELAAHKRRRKAKVYYIPKQHATPHRSCQRNGVESL